MTRCDHGTGTITRYRSGAIGEHYPRTMCRNITALRGLEPPATADEITAAAEQYVRKVTGVTTAQQMRLPAFEAAVAAVAEATTEVLAALPPRRQPPTTEPPLRRLRQA